MTPYYTDGACTIYHGDCREVLPALSTDLSFLVVTDPPYGIGRGARFHLGNDIVDLSDDVFNTAVEWIPYCPKRITALIEFCGASPDMMAAAIARHRDLGLQPWSFVMWSKPARPSLLPPFAWRFEPALVSRRKNVPCIGDRSARIPTVIEHNRVSTGEHHTEKPVFVLGKLMAPFVGTVLDPFVGSGSTLVAAKRLGRKAVGIEIDERYCEIAANRLAQGALDLFGEAQSLEAATA